MLTHPYGEVREEAPVAYQTIDGRRVDVPCGYRLDGAFSYGFWLGEGYDPGRELIIDPLMPYATYLGGDTYDIGDAIAADAEGCAYIAGNTMSTNFPVTPGAFQTTLLKTVSSYVTKFSADGSQLIYSTYLGGSTDEMDCRSIAVDSAGHAYVTGGTNSTDFPVTPGAFQTSKAGYDDNDAFVTKFSSDGASLVYSTYLGGSGRDDAYSIRVDADGFAYVGGDTRSLDFPITPGAFQTTTSLFDYSGFLSKFSADGSSLIYSTYLSGDITAIWGIAVDTAGHVYATGGTTASDFPVTSGAFQTTIKGDMDIYVTKFSPDGSSLVYSTFVGGSSRDESHSICIDEQGNAYVTGYTQSTDFPVTSGAAQSTYGGGEFDAVVFKLSADGSALVYSSYLGGSAQDAGGAIALTSGNRACVVGYTQSSDFPVTPWVRSTAMQGDIATFLTIISEDGTSFIVSNYISGDGITQARDVAVGADGSLYISGSTTSSNFPVTPGAFQTTLSAPINAFVYRTKFVMYAKASVVITKL